MTVVVFVKPSHHQMWFCFIELIGRSGDKIYTKVIFNMVYYVV
jgi:hypothetical protein